MIESKRIDASRRSQAGIATSGLIGGLAGGLGMALYLTGWEMAAGAGPLAAMGRFDPIMRGAALNGLLTHLAVSIVYGVLFALLWRALKPRLALRLPGWIAGILYGILLLIVALYLLLPAVSSPLAQIPALQFGVAHLIYGAILGLIYERIGRAD